MNCKIVLNKIDELNEKYLDVLEDVCNIESPTVYKEGVDAVGRYFVKLAEERGWEVEICRQEKAGDVICITMNSDSKESPIALSGHMDTVHPVGLFGTPAVKRDDTYMYGPGVVDCKGGAVAAFYAMAALEECGFDKRPVKLILQSDEETSSIASDKATIDYMCDKSAGSIAFLNLEGYSAGKATLRRKGILRYRFTVHGVAAHSAVCANKPAANAVAEAAHKILELEKLKDADGITCNCGVINGGTVANTVAAECSFLADIRFADSEQERTVKETVNKVAENNVIDGCTCELKQISHRPAMEYAERNYELLDKMNEIYAANGMPVLEANVSLGGSDAAYITECGIPCIDSIGTEGTGIHSVDEKAKLVSLSEAAKRIAAVVYCI